MPRTTPQQRQHRPSHGCGGAVRLRSALVLFVVLIALSLLLAPLPAQAQQTRSSSSDSSSLCPRCPLCARPRTPWTTKLKYCHSTTSYAISLFSHGRSELATAGGTRSSSSSHREQRQRFPRELPFATDDAVRAQCMRDATDLLLSRVRGQPQVVMPLLDVLRRKLAYPREPVVVHLAGDNGVGKTHTARLVSQALSLRCAPDRDVCDAGDSLLTIAGTGFDGMSVAEARSRIVAQVMAHVAHYPHGVVLIDDLTAMDPALVSALAPLFGRASHFAEQMQGDRSHGRHEPRGVAKLFSPWSWATTTAGPGKTHEGAEENDTHHRPSSAAWSSTSSSSSLPPPPPLSQLLVFITTDFGRQGRTVGKSRADIEAMVQSDFAALYGTLLPAYTRTFIFFPFTTAMAEDVVRSVVTDLPCALGEHLIASSRITSDAVAFLVEQHRSTWAGKENGHALRRLVEDELISQLIVHWELHPVHERLVVRFELDEEAMRVVLRLPASSHGTAAFSFEGLSPELAREGGGGGGDDREDEKDL